jgi:hypothetical protein
MTVRWLGAVAFAATGLVGASALAAPKKPPPAPPGIRWEESLKGAFERSRREGRPLLVCVNALENEGANIRLATELYPSQAWGRATRAFVCLVANPNDHGAPEGPCARYGHAPCSCHKETLSWVLRAFSPGGTLISPQHLIVEPDGEIAYRKEYFTGEESPALFETYLTRLAPFAAQRAARLDREARLAALTKGSPAEVEALATAWLEEPEDGLSALAVVSAWEDVTDKPRRYALLLALASARPAQSLGLVPWLEGASAAPDGEPGEALAWVRALLKVDRELGLWGAARVLARTRAAGLRADVLEAVSGARDGRAVATLPAAERARLEEALRLAGQKPPAGLAPRDDEGLSAVPLARRLRARAQGTTATTTPLPERLADLAPGAMRASLLAAGPADVDAHADTVLGLLTTSPYARVRRAAALALLSAKRGAGGAVKTTLLDALLDPLEGPELRALAVARLGEDPGEDPEEWSRVLDLRVGGAK